MAVKFISRKYSPCKSVSIANMQLTVWHVCLPVNRKPVSTRAGSIYAANCPASLYLLRAPVLHLFCKVEDGRQEVNS
jgi:hypothetical protein